MSSIVRRTAAHALTLLFGTVVLAAGVAAPSSAQARPLPSITERTAGMAAKPGYFNLILHQRNQWRNYHAAAGPDNGWNLIAHGFAAAGRHQHQRIPAADHVVNDCRLITAKFIKPENAAQNGARS